MQTRASCPVEASGAAFHSAVPTTDGGDLPSEHSSSNVPASSQEGVGDQSYHGVLEREGAEFQSRRPPRGGAHLIPTLVPWWRVPSLPVAQATIPVLWEVWLLLPTLSPPFLSRASVHLSPLSLRRTDDISTSEGTAGWGSLLALCPPRALSCTNQRSSGSEAGGGPCSNFHPLT